ncbi:MAG: hypothetical protein V5A44_11340 [Haloarculaceae archaeon]
MFGGQTGTVAVATLLGSQLLVLAAAYWYGRKALKNRAERRRVRTAGDHVVCPTCGAENETGYRYCRECVETLPPGEFAGDERQTVASPGSF